MATRKSAGKTAKDNLPLFNQGEELQVVTANVEVAAAWNDGDVVVLAHNLPIDTIVNRIMLPAGYTAITAATDYDIGFYEPSGADGQDVGDALDADALVDGYDFSAGLSYSLDILGTNVTIDREETIGELLSLTSETAPAGGVHLCMTLNTAGTAAGVIDMDIHLIKAH